MFPLEQNNPDTTFKDALHVIPKSDLSSYMV